MGVVEAEVVEIGVRATSTVYLARKDDSLTLCMGDDWRAIGQHQLHVAVALLRVTGGCCNLGSFVCSATQADLQLSNFVGGCILLQTPEALLEYLEVPSWLGIQCSLCNGSMCHLHDVTDIKHE